MGECQARSQNSHVTSLSESEDVLKKKDSAGRQGCWGWSKSCYGSDFAKTQIDVNQATGHHTKTSWWTITAKRHWLGEFVCLLLISCTLQRNTWSREHSWNTLMQSPEHSFPEIQLESVCPSAWLKKCLSFQPSHNRDEKFLSVSKILA